jgi:hypothetical protein
MRDHVASRRSADKLWPMESVRIEHTFECSEQTFWDKIFFDEEYNTKLFLERLKFPVWKEAKREERGGEIHRVVQVVPNMGDAPAALKKLVGDNAGYEERGIYDPVKRRYRIQIVPNALGDKLSVTGEMHSEALGADKMKRVFRAEVTAKIFGIGGMLEKRIMGDLVRSYDVSARFTQTFIAEKGLGG